MNEERIKNPYLLLYAFFDRDRGKKEAHDWGQGLARHLGVRLLEHDQENADQNKPYVCRIYDQRDACVIYAVADMTGKHGLGIWQKFSNDIFGANGITWRTLNQKVFADQRTRERIFWGAAAFFGGEVSSLSANFQKKSLAIVSSLPEATRPESILPSRQPWGTVWQFKKQSGQTLGTTLHVYAVLAQQVEQAEEIFFARHKIDLVELSLHKSYQQLRQYALARPELHRRIKPLDKALENLLEKTPPTSERLSVLQKNLTDVSNEFAQFVKWTSRITELQNTVAINSTNYEQIATQLGLFGKEDQAFKRHQQQLKHSLSQLEYDKTYYHAVTQRLDTGLQVVRADLDLHRAEKERREAQREKQRDFLLGLIGLLLGLAQLWPITDKILELLTPDSLDSWRLVRLGVNVACLNAVFFLLILLIGLGFRRK